LKLDGIHQKPIKLLQQFCCIGVLIAKTQGIGKSLFIRNRLFTVLLSPLCFILFFSPDSAWALQTHGPPEGLYVHQMAHVLFMGALIYLFWDIRRSSFQQRGWVYLQLFCLLMFLWNFIAFTGHEAHHHMKPTDFFYGDSYFQTKLIFPLTSLKLTYYLTKLDHLISVPALFFLYLALRAFYRTTIEQNKKES